MKENKKQIEAKHILGYEVGPSYLLSEKFIKRFLNETKVAGLRMRNAYILKQIILTDTDGTEHLVDLDNLWIDIKDYKYIRGKGDEVVKN